MTKTIVGQVQCPDCGSLLEIVPDAQVERVMFRPAMKGKAKQSTDTVLVTVPVAFCCGCEFSHEVSL